jgi:hypothetical protein
MAVKVTAEQVLATLREVVAERPTYVYEAPEGYASETNETSVACFYVHGNTPGCIVGHVLARLGVPLSDLALVEGRGAYKVADWFLDITDPDGATDVEHVLSVVQMHQDRGDSWGSALEAALGE